MNIDSYIEDLQLQLATAASAADDAAQEFAQRLAAALEPAARLAIIEALSDAAGEISRELSSAMVDVRLRGRSVEFVVTEDAPAPAAPALAQPAPPSGDDDGSMSRTTVRLPDAVKTQAEEAASAAGLSLNTWLVRVVQAALAGGATTSRSSNSYKGWVR